MSNSLANLKILAEGDSWFSYPLPPLVGDGVIVQLQNLTGLSIANMAQAGEEVRQMLGLEQRQEIVSRLRNDGSIHFDAMLFSGGGDDLVGDQFCVFLTPAPPGSPPTAMINGDALGAALDLLSAEFTELVKIRDSVSPGTVIFANAYDFPPVTGIGVCGYGPWLKPSLDYMYNQMGVANPDPNLEFKVVMEVLTRFNQMLVNVAANSQNFIVVPTQGTLIADNNDWQNEIHPSTDGFVKIAKKFQAALEAKFS